MNSPSGAGGNTKECKQFCPPGRVEWRTGARGTSEEKFKYKTIFTFSPFSPAFDTVNGSVSECVLVVFGSIDWWSGEVDNVRGGMEGEFAVGLAVDPPWRLLTCGTALCQVKQSLSTG